MYIYLYTYIYTHIFKSSVFCKSCVLNDHLLRPSFCRFIAVVGSWTLWRQSPARDAAFGLCQLAVGCAVRQPQSSPSRHCEYEIGDLASLYSKHRFSTRQASLLPVVFFLLPFFVAPMNFLYMRRQSITEQQQRWFLDVWRKQLAFTLQTNYWPRLWRVEV